MRDRESQDDKALRQQEKKSCHDGWRQVVSSLFIANASVFIKERLSTSYFYLRSAVFLNSYH